MYENIKATRPYFYSLREINESVSLDLRIPLTWKYEHITATYRSIKTLTQDKNEKFILLSLISTANQEGYDIVLTCATEIIQINKEEEEKRKLFEQKVNELKQLFQKESLEKLKDINFLDEHEQQNTTGIGVVRQGDNERSDGGQSPQTETN